MAEQVTIYALCDESGAVEYVGQTRNVKARQRRHRGWRPGLTMTVLALVDESEADDAERRWIAHYRAQGRDLLNAAADRPRGKHKLRGTGECWIAVRIPNDTKEWLEQWAERKDTSMSWIVRRLLVEAQQGRRDERNGL